MKAARKFKGSVVLAAVFLLAFSVNFAYSLPEGESVTEGQATFDRSESNTLKINTSSDKLIVDYSSFNIGASESVYFYQPSSSSEALNRVTGSGLSNIFGSLTANGIIYLINPNGINIGQSANINAAGFIASTLNIANVDFLENNYVFSKLADKTGRAVINNGYIKVRETGRAALLGSAVANAGTIETSLGSVVLAAGEQITLNLDTAGMISVVINKPVQEEIFGASGQKLDSAVSQSGSIINPGGRVILAASVLNHVFDYAVNNSGMIQARSLVSHDGVVELVASGAPVINTGAITAGEIKISVTDSDILQGGSILAAQSITLEARAVEVNFIMSAASQIVASGEPINVNAGIIIQAPEVRIITQQFGTNAMPLNISANNLYIRRTSGNIDILDSLGIGNSLLIRGPPGGFGAIYYNKEANLELQASQVNLVSSRSFYFYGNITFHNFKDMIPDSNIYFEAGRTYTFKDSLSIIGAVDVGPEEFFVKLRSSAAGQYWYLDIEAEGYTLERVNLSDAYALNNVIIPIGVDAGNNVNFEIDPTWDGGGTTNNWSDAVNWSGNAVPLSTEDATFNATSIKDSTVDAAFAGTIRNLLINAGYTGTITFERSLSVRNFNQATGTVSLGSQTLSVSNNFTISGGTFSEGTSTVIFTGAGAMVNIFTSETFFNLTFAPTTSGANKIVSNNDTLIVAGTLTLTEGNINQGTRPAAGTISARGDIIQASTFDGGSGLIIITGTANQTFTGNATTSAGDLPDISIDKTGGTLTLAGTIRINGSGAGAWTYIAGTVDATTNNSLLVLNGGNTIDGQGTSGTMAFDNIEITAGTQTLAGNLDVDGNLTISGGTLNTSGSDYSVNVAGNWSNAGTFTSNDSVVTLDGSSSSTMETGGTGAGKDFETLMINKSGGAVVTLIIDNLDVDGTLTISSGVLYLNGRSITTTTSFVNDGTLRLQGIETVSWTVNDTDSGAWEYAGRNIAEAITIKDFGATDYFNLVINDTNTNKAIFSSASALDVNGALTLSSGTFTAPTGSFTVSGNWVNNGGTFNAGTGTVTFDGTTIISGSSITTFNNITITGTLTGHVTNINVSGNWTNNGTFVNNSGTVTFIDNNQTSVISGSTTFFNFTSTTAGKQITFTAGTTQTIAGTLTLTGASGNLIILRSSVSASQWSINAQGSKSVSFVDVKDSNNINASEIAAADSKDSGNNTNWNLVDHFTITGTSGQTAGTSNQLTITAIDGAGGISVSFTGDKALIFSGGNSIGSFTPTATDKNGAAIDFGTATTVTFTNGVATAGGSMVLYKAETAAITVSYGASSTAAALSVTVSRDAADKLLFIQQPSDTLFGSTIVPAITIQISDQFGNAVVSDNATNVSMAIGTSPGIGELSGTAVNTASAGTATFSNLRISFPGAGYTLTASSIGLTSAISGAFNITGSALDPAAAALADSQLSTADFLRLLLPDATQLGLYQASSFVPAGPVYLYRPLTSADISAFDRFILRASDYRLFNGVLDYTGSEDLAEFFRLFI
ncbi:MAG: filamentous hemagglutinin N-terminal domain-containing protein [Candidatus Omnitrophica bacterium]|nr:filamentous hemagglutinin N-terminal domain-containing protein [Candidatus Omnitrophota bacterium]